MFLIKPNIITRKEVKYASNRLALIVGRFQPLHEGHKFLIRKAIEENESVAIAIGQKRKGELLTYKERKGRLQEFFNNQIAKKRIVRLVYMRDEKTDKIWLKKLKKKLNITERTKNFFYTGDWDLPEAYVAELKSSQIDLRKVKRIIFDYQSADGKTYRVSSATEIRSLTCREKQNTKANGKGIGSRG